jgi:hypothetical protein
MRMRIVSRGPSPPAGSAPMGEKHLRRRDAARPRTGAPPPPRGCIAPPYRSTTSAAGMHRALVPEQHLRRGDATRPCAGTAPPPRGCNAPLHRNTTSVAGMRRALAPEQQLRRGDAAPPRAGTRTAPQARASPPAPSGVRALASGSPHPPRALMTGPDEGGPASVPSSAPVPVPVPSIPSDWRGAQQGLSLGLFDFRGGPRRERRGRAKESLMLKIWLASSGGRRRASR